MSSLELYANIFILVFFFFIPWFGDPSHFFSNTIIISKYGTSVAIASQIFGWEERSCSYKTNCPGLFCSTVIKKIVCTCCLSCIFNNNDVRITCNSMILSISAHCPKRCTGTITLVFGVKAFLIFPAEMLYVKGSGSASTSFNPRSITTSTVATK